MEFFLISLSTFYVYFILKTSKSITILSNEKYDIKKYIKKISKNHIKTFGLLELSFIILILIAIVTNEKVTGICTVVLYTILCLKLLKNKEKFKVNINSVRTFIITTLIFVTLNVSVFLDYSQTSNMFLDYNPAGIYYTILYIIMYFIWSVFALAGFFNNLFNKKSSKKKKKN